MKHHVISDETEMFNPPKEQLVTIFENPICSKGVEKESCLRYRIGKCCDYKKQED